MIIQRGEELVEEAGMLTSKVSTEIARPRKIQNVNKPGEYTYKLNKYIEKHLDTSDLQPETTKQQV